MSEPEPTNLIPTPPLSELADSERIAAVQAALSEAGSIKGASKLLGMEPVDLRRYMKNHPELRAYLPNAKAPTLSEQIAAPEAPVIAGELVGSEEEIALAMAKADAQLRAGLTTIGLRQESIDEAAALCQFAKLQFDSMMHMVSGGNAKTYIEVLEEVRRINDTLRAGGLDFEEEQMLRQDRSALLRILLDMGHFTREATLTAAKIEQMRAESGGKKGSRGKPKLGVSPLMATEVTTDGPARVRIAQAG